jgi:plastocyanin
MSRTIRVLVVATLVAGSIAAIAGPASAATVVRGRDSRWHPATVSIARGGAVRWKAVDVHHTVHSYGSNWSYSRDLPAGTSTSPRTFNRRGTFRFYCTIHGSVVGGTCSGMCGRVVVG